MSLLRPPWCRDAAAGHVHRIHVVEDDPAIRDLLADFLDLEGYAVSASPNGAAALEHVRGGPPCLVLVDLMMPVMDGAECIRHCRADARLHDPPIVVASAASVVRDVAGLPVQGFVHKPFDLHRLLAVLVTILGANETTLALSPPAPQARAEMPPMAS